MAPPAKTIIFESYPAKTITFGSFHAKTIIFETNTAKMIIFEAYSTKTITSAAPSNQPPPSPGGGAGWMAGVGREAGIGALEKASISHQLLKEKALAMSKNQGPAGGRWVFGRAAQGAGENGGDSR